MLDRFKSKLGELSVSSTEVYSYELDNLTFKSLKPFTDDVKKLLVRLFNGYDISLKEYDLLDSYGLVGKRRKRDKRCTPCDIESEKIMFFCKTKITDFHKGKFGFMCKWCAQKRSDYIGLDHGYISIDFSCIKDDEVISNDNFEDRAKTMGLILRKKKDVF